MTFSKALTAAVLFTIATLTPINTAQSSRIMVPVPHKAINISVSFNSTVPLTEEAPEKIAEMKKSARTMFYRFASQECVVLKETIAETCKLRSLNISSQIRQHGNAQPSIYMNGSAQFSVTLKSAIEE